MFAQPSKAQHSNRKHEKRRLEPIQLYAPRCPMAQLLDQYRVTAVNSELPLVHFAIPIDITVLYSYAEKHGLNEYSANLPNIVSPVSVLVATEHLSEDVQYELDFGWPFELTADCDVILALYNNYTMEEKMLIDEDQEDVIQMVQEALGLDKSIRPKWYFDIHDPWLPDDEDEDTD
ncbi:hypothetical protein J3R83DRAFT_5225 [Lanmaoa asiatica]|nr:hypothetical protein J3R83DRAFT_5225 [Lanmaoa asiatica]